MANLGKIGSSRLRTKTCVRGFILLLNECKCMDQDVEDLNDL